MFASLSVLLLLGWSLGWLVARSAVAAPVRGFLLMLDQETLAWRRVSGGLRLFVAAIHYPSAFLAGVTHCAACSGFWLGLGLSAVAGDLGLSTALPAPVLGVAMMGVNALADAVLAGFLGLADRGDARHG